MYVLSPYPNILYALDLTQPGAPLKWQYNPKPAAAAQGVACCDVVNRGPTFANGRIFFTTLDAHVAAVNAETGEEVWKTKLGDINRGETMTMAPLVAKGQGDRRHLGRRVRRPGLDPRARRQHGTERLEGLQHGPRSGREDRPELQALLRQRQGTGPRRHHLAARTPGGRAAAPSGDGCPTTPISTFSITAPAIRVPGTRASAPATINGPRASSPAIPIPATRAGSTRPRPHDLHDWDTVNEMILLDMEWEGRPAKSDGASRAHRFRLRDRPGRPARCSRPNPSTRSPRSPASTSRPGGSRSIADEGAGQQPGRCATSARRRPARRTGTRAPSRTRRASSTSRI